MTVFPFVLAILAAVLFVVAVLVPPAWHKLVGLGLAVLTIAWILQLTTTGTLVHL